jgi:peroxiredoxin
MTPIALGASAPDFNLPGVDGQSHSLSGYASSTVLVVVWSCNHCPYVQAYEGRLMAIAGDFADRGVRVMAICSNSTVTHPQDSFERMVERAEAKGFNFDYLHDKSQELARAFGAQRTPEVFVFDADRRLRYQGGIDDSWEDESAVTKTPLRDALEALLEGRDPSPTSTPAVGCSIKWNP